MNKRAHFSCLMRRRLGTALAATFAISGVVCCTSASAAIPAVGWSISSTHAPTDFAPGGSGDYVLVARDTGAVASGGTIEVTDKLPAGTSTSATPTGTGWKCSEGAGQSEVTCTSTTEVEPDAEATVVEIPVAISPAAKEGEEVVNQGEVRGGGASAPASVSDPTKISSAPAPFGVQSFAVEADGLNGAPATQAGGHPYALTTSFHFNTVANSGSDSASRPFLPAGGDVKDVHVSLPPGFVGDPQAASRCPQAELKGDTPEGAPECPVDSQIGTATIAWAGIKEQTVVALYNMVPPAGMPAQFGFNFVNVLVRVDFQVSHTASGYLLESTSLNVSEAYPIFGVSLSIWGNPGEANHDSERHFSGPPKTKVGATSGLAGVGFLTQPADCASEALGAPSWSITADSWMEPGVYTPASSTLTSAVNGCEALSFQPTISFAPETTQAGEPSGYRFAMALPQTEAAESPATPDLKDATVTLPAGVSISPSSAGGLEACSPSQIDLESTEAASCPPASKIGAATIETPLLEHPLTGQVFLAEPKCDGVCSEADAEEGRMVGLYLQAEGSGVRIKLPGSVEIGGAGSAQSDLKPSQLRAKFLVDPQLPFSRLTLSLKGGARAPLVNPSTCGTFTTTSELVPWSAPFTAVATPFSQFTVNGCYAPSFAPSFTAGTANNQAGGFSPFTMTLTRKDGEEDLSTVSMTMPSGVEGMLSTVPLCGDAQANAGTCPAASLIGNTTVTSGPGPDAYRLGGQVYLTEKFEGAPFGLSIVVPAIAGPFHLAGTNGAGDVVVRAKIDVNPKTAQVTVISNPLPQMLDGIPLQLKLIHVSIDREGFMFNPTSCEPMSVAATVTAAEGMSHAASSRFRAANCATLPFEPSFSTLIHAHHTRKNGEYMHVVIKSGFGQASLKKVHVTLPAALPSRDSTLKLACTEAQFAKNPSGCPAGSVVGHAVVHTPVVAKPLEGPAIFVSHGGLAFPDLDLVLQGEGVTIVNVGNTNIHKGITSTTFGAIPDVPVSRIDLVLPAGPHSALAGEGNLCRKHLRMPTEIEGQNGAVIRQKTKIAVEGCGPQFFVRKKHVRGSKATIVLHVPYAGKLVANGKGISKVSKRIAKHGGRMAVTVKLKAHFRRMLALSHRHHITVKVHLSFHSKHHKTLHAAVRVRLR